jgi:hypothetical protein
VTPFAALCSEDLLVLKKIQKIPIIKPSEFWKFEKGRRKNN